MCERVRIHRDVTICHATSNRERKPEMQTRIKKQPDIREMSGGRSMRHCFTSGKQTINGICMHCNIFC